MKKTRETEAQAQSLEHACWFRAAYSGEASEKFWKELRSSKNRTLFGLGCILQDVEARVLVEVNQDMSVRIRERLQAQRKRKR